MSISIVMLTYNNYEKFLRSMTSMFYFITEPRIKEFIFLDNGSHETELKKFLRQLDAQISKVRVIFSDENLGIAKGRKVLYDVARGDYIASFDSDIVCLNSLISDLDVPIFANAISFRASTIFFLANSLYKPILIKPPGLRRSVRALHPVIGSFI